MDLWGELELAWCSCKSELFSSEVLLSMSEQICTYSVRNWFLCAGAIADGEKGAEGRERFHSVIRKGDWSSSRPPCYVRFVSCSILVKRQVQLGIRSPVHAQNELTQLGTCTPNRWNMRRLWFCRVFPYCTKSTIKLKVKKKELELSL
jgi:hypothetical protein